MNIHERHKMRFTNVAFEDPTWLFSLRPWHCLCRVEVIARSEIKNFLVAQKTFIPARRIHCERLRQCAIKEMRRNNSRVKSTKCKLQFNVARSDNEHEWKHIRVGCEIICLSFFCMSQKGWVRKWGDWNETTQRAIDGDLESECDADSAGLHENCGANSDSSWLKKPKPDSAQMRLPERRIGRFMWMEESSPWGQLLSSLAFLASRLRFKKFSAKHEVFFEKRLKTGLMTTHFERNQRFLHGKTREDSTSFLLQKTRNDKLDFLSKILFLPKTFPPPNTSCYEIHWLSLLEKA